jgi:general secretion pathway protein A
MYARFFGLSKEPFSIAPDPRFLFMSEQHREALAHLMYGLGGGGGFVLLTGEIGAGKTTVCRCFLEQVPAHCLVAYVFNPKLTVIELLQTVFAEFGLPPAQPADSVKAHVDALNTFLLDAHAKGQQAVLVIDEAQSLSAEVLEQLRLLTNLETAERKLLQIILVGQPELRDLLAQPALEQLAQRVIARFHLGALTQAQTMQYIRHRVAVAGSPAMVPFDDAALARIHQLSGGVPRRINLLADRALLGAYAQSQTRADKNTVAQAAQEVFAQAPAGQRWVPAAAAVATAALALLLGGAWWWTQHGGTSVARGPTPAQRVAPSVPPAAAAPAVAAAAPASSVALVAAAASVAAAAAVASAPAPPASAALALSITNDPAALWAAAQSQTVQATTWRELALRWNVSIGEGDPCVAVLQAQLACYRSGSGGLLQLRQAGRPSLLMLRAPDASGNPSGSVAYAILRGMDEQSATVQAGREVFRLSWPALTRVWRGDFATFWRTPPGWREGIDVLADPTLKAWLDQRLTGAGFAGPQPLLARLRAYQLAQGLAVDGRAGPLTLMLLGRDSAAPEPRLTFDR